MATCDGFSPALGTSETDVKEAIAEIVSWLVRQLKLEGSEGIKPPNKSSTEESRESSNEEPAA